MIRFFSIFLAFLILILPTNIRAQAVLIGVKTGYIDITEETQQGEV